MTVRFEETAIEVTVIKDLQLLQLLHLADSALPVGATAHSFGLETLVAEEILCVEQLEAFLRDYLEEAGVLECTFCRLGYRLTTLSDQNDFERRWLVLNDQLSAFKTARESRIASATLGRRLLQLVLGLEEHTVLQRALLAAKAARTDIHYSIAFGLVSSVLGIDETAAVLAYQQQSLQGVVFACQRLMPLGQSQAGKILWRLKPVLIRIASRSEAVAQRPEDIVVFMPLPELSSMRHPVLSTRLFIS